jgi:uncharacterized repeat protein (TIGR01451 family)
VTLVITAATASNLATGTTFANTATASSTTPDPDPTNNSATATTTVTTSADVRVTKAAESAQATAGGTLVYDIQVTNDGPSDAQAVSLSDPLPAGTTLVPMSSELPAGCTATATAVSCALGALPAGQATTLKLTVQLSSALADRTKLANTTTVTSATSDPNPANNTSTASTIVVRSNDLELAKTAAPNPAVAGAPLTYTLVVNNLGPSDSNDSTIVDPLPPGTTYVSSSPLGACALAGDNVTVICNVGPVPALAQHTVTITVRPASDTPTGTTLTNTATVTGIDEDPDPANNAATAFTPVIASADLSITKTGPVTVVAGTHAAYTVTVINHGPSDANGVALTDPLPAGTAFVTATASQGSCNGGPTVDCSLGVLADGAHATVTVVLDVSPSFLPGPLSNTATVASNTPDPNPANNSATATATVSSRADVALTKQGPVTVRAGDTIAWTVSATNHGPSDAQDVTITDSLPPGVRFVSASSPCTESAGRVSCNFATLPVGAAHAVQVQITGTVSQSLTGPVVTNMATVASATPDPDPANNQASATTLLQHEADLAITKTVTPTSPTPGQSLSFTLTVTNDGPSTAEDAVVTDPINPAINIVQVTSTSAAGPCVVVSHVVGCPLGTVLPGAAPVVITISGVLSSSFTGAVGNTASVASPTPDPTPGNNTATIAAAPSAEADLVLTKTADQSRVDAGAPVTYTLTVTNRGPSDAQNVVITDVLDPSLNFHSAGPGCAFVTVTRTLQCQQDTLALDASAHFTFTADVTPTAQAGALVNQASVAAATSDPDPGNNTDAVTVTVVPDSDLGIAKTVDSASAKIGGTLTYTVTVANHGPSLATGVHADDVLPAGLSFTNATASTGTYDNATGVWTVGTLPVDGQATLTLRAAISPTAAGTIVTNRATVAGDQPDPDSANNTASARTEVAASADLSLTKAATPTPVDAGAPLTYTLDVTNHGPSTAAAVRVTDPLPSGLTLTSATASRGTCAGGPPIECNLGALANGEQIVVTIVATVSPSLNPSITPVLTNTAGVSSSTDDPDPLNNTASATTPTAVQADISVIKEGPPTEIAGNRMVYTVVVTNNGPSDAQDVAITDPMPVGLSTISAAPSQGSCSGDAVITCNLPILVSGARITVRLAVQVSPAAGGEMITNTAAAQSTTPDPNPNNNQASAHTSVFAATTLDLAKHGPATVVAGQSISWTVTAHNPGPSDAQDVVIRDPLPKGVTFHTASTPCTFAARAVTCRYSTVPAGATQTITIDGNVSPAYTGVRLANTASASSSSDPTTHSASTSATVTHEAALAVVKEVDSHNAGVGSTLTYAVKVTNHGPSDATGVTATDALPAGLLLSGAHPSQGGYQRATGLWSIGALPPGSTAVLTVHAAVQGSAAGTTIINHARIAHSDEFDPDVADSSAAASTAVATSTAASTAPTTLPAAPAPSSSTPATSQPSTSLPFTGSAAAPLTRLAAILIGTGSAALAIASLTRRRGRHRK